MNSAEKQIWLLKRLGEAPYEMSLTELSKEMGYAKSGLYKILSVLEREGFVLQNGSSKKYSLGPALYQLGTVYSDKKGLWPLAEPIMQRVSRLTEETVSIGIWEGNAAILAYKIESPHAIRLERKIGQRLPVNAGAIGKLLTAFQDQGKVNRLLRELTFNQTAQNTITDLCELEAEYERIRQQGYAISDEENTPGAFGISAPIRDQSGMVSACLCVAGPKERFTPNKVNDWIKVVMDGAAEISRLLGFR